MSYEEISQVYHRFLNLVCFYCDLYKDRAEKRFIRPLHESVVKLDHSSSTL